MSIWGCTNLQPDTIWSKLFFENSISSNYIKIRETRFDTDYEDLEIVLGPDIVYWDPKTQMDLIALAQDLVSLPFAYSYEFWLEDFVNFTNDEIKFTENLHNRLHLYPNRINLAGGKIRFSRFTVKIRNLFEQNSVQQFARLVHGTVKKYSYPITVYHRKLADLEQGAIVAYETWRAMVFVFFILILFVFILNPHLLLTGLFALTFISISCGVFGFSCIFGVQIDSYSMLAYICSLPDTFYVIQFSILGMKLAHTEHRLTSAYNFFGQLIVQCTSLTVFSSIVLFIVDCYATKTFAKIYILSSLISSYHAIVLFPTIFGFMNFVTETISTEQNVVATSFESDSKSTVSITPENFRIPRIAVVGVPADDTGPYSTYSNSRSWIESDHRNDCRKFLFDRLTYDPGTIMVPVYDTHPKLGPDLSSELELRYESNTLNI